MNHIGTKTIETERLILRQFTVEDSQAMFENWASDDEVTKYLTWPTHTSEEISKSILRDWVDSCGCRTERKGESSTIRILYWKKMVASRHHVRSSYCRQRFSF